MLKKKTIPLCATGLILAAVVLGPPAEAQEDPGCTLTQGYWKTHPEAWPDMLTVGGVAYAAEDLIALLATPPKGDATYILAKQLIAAQLNVLNKGADAVGAGVYDVILAAEDWLATVGLGSWPTGAVREAGIQLAEQLDAFNNGLNGVPHCDDVVVIPPPEPEPQD